LFFPPEQTDTSNYIAIATIVTAPTSRGSITIGSTNPLDDPIIDPAILHSDYDKAVMIEAVKGAKEFVTATPFQDYIIGPSDALAAANTDNELLQYVQDTGVNIQHPVGTAAMSAASSTDGVVNPDLLVKNVVGLRIVDASVFVSCFYHNLCCLLIVWLAAFHSERSYDGSCLCLC
jgi:choline dehydrogenase-like flavoprotein